MDNQIIVVDGGQFDESIVESVGGEQVYSPNEIREVLRREENTLWLAKKLPPLHELAEVGPSRYRRRLLVLEPLDRKRLPLLRTMFDKVVAPDEGIRLLPEEEIAAVLGAEHPEDYLIGGVYNAEDDLFTLYRGDLDVLTVPLDWFETNAVAAPDSTGFDITDYGQAVRLGDYEAGADTLLYEFDADYRRREKAKRRTLDDSLGGCLRRLRLARGFNQDDFESVTARTIRRIEKGEAKPRRKTIEKIAEELGVEPEEIETY